MKFQLKYLCLGITLALAAHAPLSQAGTDADSAALQKQRALFIDARSAVKKGQITKYKKLAPKLKDYPLYPYLEYWRHGRRLSRLKQETIDEFSARFPNTHLGPRLKRRWLNKLTKQGRWKEYLSAFEPTSNTRMNCLQRRALYKTGKKTEAFEGIETLWLVGKSQPRACDPLFAAWRDHGGMSNDLVWQRIELAMNRNQAYLARYLERFLTAESRKTATLWRKVHRNPELIFKERKLKKDTEINRRIISHGVKRLARRQAGKAAQYWDKLVMKYSFDEQTHQQTETYIALALARQNAPEAMHWLGNITERDNMAVHEQRILTALNQESGMDAIFWMEQMPENEQQEERWQYWRARALEASGMHEDAWSIYEKLAQKRDYYGFMAADRIGTPYAFEDAPLTYDSRDLSDVVNLPAVVRAKELRALGDTVNARREWYWITSRLNEEQLLKASQLAHEWNWHDRAIVTMGQTDYRDDLNLRFPLLHKTQVTRHADSQNIDPSWAYAVIRQESAFISDARSPKGAMGLMQIMPKTGKFIAKQLNTRLKNTNQLLDVNTNIRFGISYLRKVMNRFDDNTVLATAAYNAGTQRVKGWLPEESSMTADHWIENVPYKETRNYLKNVLTYSVIYDQRMGRTITPLKQRMPGIGKKET